MNLPELSAALEALWRLQGTGAAWDELVRFLAENIDEQVTLWLLARRRADLASRSFDEDELARLWRFLGYELHQARVQCESRSTGHPDDAKESGRKLAVLAIAQSEVAGWYRADQDRRYGADRPKMYANDQLGNCAAAAPPRDPRAELIAPMTVEEDRLARRLRKAEARSGVKVAEERQRELRLGFSVVGKRRAELARALDFEVVELGEDLWISRKLNEVMIVVEQAMLGGKIAGLGDGSYESPKGNGSFGDLATPEKRAEELRVLRHIDTEPSVIETINAAFRLGGTEAVAEIVRELAKETTE
jgi:hypothetical protein